MSSSPARANSTRASGPVHTGAPALAGIASTRPRRGAPLRRVLALPLLLVGLLAGGAAVHAGASSSPDEPASAENAVTAFGGAPDLGPTPGLDAHAPVLAIAAHPDRDGYWLAAADGGVFALGDAPFRGSAAGMALNAPIVGVASTPSGDGYWLAAADGGVFAFGDAAFQGSLGGHALASPILGIAASPDGQGYWLAAADGGVFAFGDAAFYGSAIGRSARPVVDVAAAPSGDGYWLLAADGGVFAFGDAPFRGSAVDAGDADAIGIAVHPDGHGYWVVRRSGAVHALGATHHGDVAAVDAQAAAQPSVGIAARARGGYWVAQGERYFAPMAAPDVSQHPFLVCTRRIESGGNYQAVSGSGTYRGAYQFARSTWDATARYAGRLDLVGVDPAAASPADQDQLALALYGWQGASPWLGRCAGL